MKFTILSLHPQAVRGFLSEGLLEKAAYDGRLQFDVINIRDFSDPPHFRCDDRPYGGGPGMILKPEPIARALESIAVAPEAAKRTRKILLSAKGRPFNQKVAQEFAQDFDHLVFVCGRYEGVDERIADFYVDEELSIGEYILMGGEVAALAVVEAVARLREGILGNAASTEVESFSKSATEGEGPEVEYDQYTRPPVFENHEVPEVLRSGNHAAIESWRRLEKKRIEGKNEKRRA